MLLQPGSLILDGKYRIDSLIGQGASAEVYRATQVALRARRAIKVLRRDGADIGSTAFGDYRRRFELEAQLGAQLNHQNLVHVYDFVQADDRTLMLVMEYAAGGSLAERLIRQRESGALMPVEEVVGIALDAASGLEQLHARDAVHRDIKPNNILLDENGRAKVADLGLAQVSGGPSMRSQLSQAMPHPGTPAYMSPEQATSSLYLTPASDVYALGLVLFEMLTGRAYKNIRPGTRVASLRPDVPPQLDDLVARMLDGNPAARPFDGAEVVRELGATGIAPIWRRAEAARVEPAPFVAGPAAPTPTAAPASGPAAASPATAGRASRLWPALGLAALLLAVVGVLAVVPGLQSMGATPAPAASPTAIEIAAATATRAAVVVPPSPTAAGTPVAPTAEPSPRPTSVSANATSPPPTLAPQPTWTPVPPTPAVVFAQFGGTWLSNFATLNLTQDGPTVVGTYTRYGFSEARPIEGTLVGDRLRGTFAGQPENVFDLQLSPDGGQFDGTWSSADGTRYQWCGVRSGPLPDGCGFSGKWLTEGYYKWDYRPTAQIVQTGDRVAGTFMNGVLTSPGTIEGRIGSDGPGSHYTVSGEYRIDRFSGPFRWVMVDYARIGAGQFRGWSEPDDGTQRQWCGWRETSAQPTPCMVMDHTTPVVDTIQFCTDAGFDRSAERCTDPRVEFDRPVRKLNATWVFKNVERGTPYIRRWYRNDQLEKEYRSAWNGSLLYTDYVPDNGQFLPGNWRLDYYLNGELAGRGMFTIR